MNSGAAELPASVETIVTLVVMSPFNSTPPSNTVVSENVVMPVFVSAASDLKNCVLSKPSKVFASPTGIAVKLAQVIPAPALETRTWFVVPVVLLLS